MKDTDVEQMIQDKCKTAPRITPADIEANIASEHYFTAENGVRDTEKFTNPAQVWSEALSLLTFCVLVLRNGFTVTGESACASPENFDAEIGRKVARQNAINKIWPLMGYELKSKLSAQSEYGCSPVQRPVLTEADALADVKGEPRPSSTDRSAA